jgi:hypothetical protein
MKIDTPDYLSRVADCMIELDLIRSGHGPHPLDGSGADWLLNREPTLGVSRLLRLRRLLLLRTLTVSFHGQIEYI